MLLLASEARVCHEFDGYSFTGTTIPISSRLNVTLAGCQAACLASADPVCLGYIWSPEAGCIRASEINTFYRSPKEGIHTGRCAVQIPHVLGDFPGNDLGNTPAPDADACNYLCETRARAAYTWSNYNGGTCWFKSKALDTPVGPSDGSVISGEPYTCIADADSDVVGYDLVAIQKPFWRQCCPLCRRTEGCTLATWSAYNGGTCWLKAPVVGVKFVRAEGIMTMFPHNLCPTNREVDAVPTNFERWITHMSLI